MKFSLKTKGFNDMIDITDRVSSEVGKSGVKDGICLVSCPGSTCGFTTIEYEEGVIKDLRRALERIASISEDYEHCKKWGDCNGYAHVRSALMRPFIALPVEDGRLILGQWQQLVFLDFDNRPRQREIMVKIISSKPR